MAIICKELDSAEEFAFIFSFIQQLNRHFDEATFHALLAPMRAGGYRCVAAFENGKILGISGFWIGYRFWCGKYIDIDNFVVDEVHRGRGIGQMLLAWLEEKGRAEGCDQAVLDGYMTNFTANKFYVKNDFLQLGYHMIKPLNSQKELPKAALQKRT